MIQNQSIVQKKGEENRPQAIKDGLEISDKVHFNMDKSSIDRRSFFKKCHGKLNSFCRLEVRQKFTEPVNNELNWPDQKCVQMKIAQEMSYSSNILAIRPKRQPTRMFKKI